MRQAVPAILFFIAYQLMAGGLSLADTRVHQEIIFFDMATTWMMNIGMFSLAAACGAIAISLPGMELRRKVLLSVAYLGAIAIAWMVVMNVARHAGFLMSFGPLVSMIAAVNLALGAAFLRMATIGLARRESAPAAA